MAVKASNILPADAYNKVRRDALAAKVYAQAKSSEMLANFSANETLALLETMKFYRDQIDTASAVPGIVAYAQAQEDDPAYDIVAEYLALKVSIQAVIDDILATFPSATFHSFSGEDQSFQEFTPAQTTTLRGLLDTVVSLVT